MRFHPAIHFRVGSFNPYYLDSTVVKLNNFSQGMNVLVWFGVGGGAGGSILSRDRQGLATFYSGARSIVVEGAG